MQMHVVENYRELYPDIKGKALTDKIIKELFCCEIDIVRSAAGKPFVQWDRSEEPPHISVSHSGDVFVCAFEDCNIGVDIQERREIDFDKIGRRYFTEDEIEYMGENDPVRFFEIWTRKEAFAKYTGKGLVQVMAGESVLHRDDVVFNDCTILHDIQVSVCRPAGKDHEEDEIHIFNRE